MIINEKEVIDNLKKAKKVILLEPKYRHPYLALGLAKISQFVKKNGGEAIYQNDYVPQSEDLICVTSLFTYDSNKVLEALYDIYFVNKNPNVLVGGIYASLMPFNIEKQYPNVKIFRGYSKVLDMVIPDYSLNNYLIPPWNDFSYIFTTRGCKNACSYCAVPKLEKEHWINPKWKTHLNKTKQYVMVYDNNLTMQPKEHIKDVFDFFHEEDKKLLFDNGLDCKYIDQDIAKILKQAKYYRSGLRLAFDRIEDDGIFQSAIEQLLSIGIGKSNFLIYVLFNFTDTPQEAYYRMKECVRLGVRPYPQQYIPLNKTSRQPIYVGKYWTEKLVRVFRYFFFNGFIL